MSDDQRFSIGEVAIYVRPGSAHYGCEVTIISDLRERDAIDLRTGEKWVAPCYEVDSNAFGRPPFGNVWRVRPTWLRKKKQPRNDARRLVETLLKAPRIPDEEPSHVH